MIDERFFRQALETFEQHNCKVGDIVDSYNRRVIDTGICPTITTTGGLYRLNKEDKKFRIRKLTENECYKLMGFTSEDCNKCKAIGISKTQLYKQAGNSIVTNCIQLIWEHIFKSQYDPEYIPYDENFTQAVMT